MFRWRIRLVPSTVALGICWWGPQRLLVILPAPCVEIWIWWEDILPTNFAVPGPVDPGRSICEEEYDGLKDECNPASHF